MWDLINSLVDVIRATLFIWLFCRVALAWVREKPVSNRWIAGTFMLQMLIFKL